VSGSVFLDTNVLVYTLARDDPRQTTAKALLAAGGVISVQCLNELAMVARRKLRFSWRETAKALNAVRQLCPPPLPLTLATHEAALGIAERLGYRFYDSLILASALEAGCSTLYSEDLQDGQVVEGTLAIRNPFRP
jgi:predicted nucleic acid-binding protein